MTPIFTTSARKYFDSRYVYFIGTAEDVNHCLDDSRMGIIESPTFTLEDPKCSLLISGGKDRQKTYLAIHEENPDGKLGKELIRFVGTETNNFQELPLDASKFLNRPLRIRIVDQSKEKWGHINFGGLFQQTADAETP